MFFGRPPRLPLRYCTCRPPYDLTDEEVIAPSHLRDLAISRLDPDGWNLSGNLNRHTVVRLKLALCGILEEVLDLSLVPPAPDLEQSQKARYARHTSSGYFADFRLERSSTKRMQLGRRFRSLRSTMMAVGIQVWPQASVLLSYFFGFASTIANSCYIEFKLDMRGVLGVLYT